MINVRVRAGVGYSIICSLIFRFYSLRMIAESADGGLAIVILISIGACVCTNDVGLHFCTLKLSHLYNEHL